MKSKDYREAVTQGNFLGGCGGDESEEDGEDEGEKRKDVESLLQVLKRRAQLLHSPTLWLTFSLSLSLSDRQLSLAVVSL